MKTSPIKKLLSQDITFLEKSKLLVAHIHYYNESNGEKGVLSGSEERRIWQLAEKSSETQGLNNHAKIFNLGTLLFADLQTKYLISKLSYAELEKVSLVISTNSLAMVQYIEPTDSFLCALRKSIEKGESKLEKKAEQEMNFLIQRIEEGVAKGQDDELRDRFYLWTPNLLRKDGEKIQPNPLLQRNYLDVVKTVKDHEVLKFQMQHLIKLMGFDFYSEDQRGKINRQEDLKQDLLEPEGLMATIKNFAIKSKQFKKVLLPSEDYEYPAFVPTLQNPKDALVLTEAEQDESIKEIEGILSRSGYKGPTHY